MTERGITADSLEHICFELGVWTDPLTLAEHLAGGATMEGLKRIHHGYAFLKSSQRLVVPMRPSLPRALGGGLAKALEGDR